MATPKLDEYAKLVNDVLQYKLKLKTIPSQEYFKNNDLYKKIIDDVYTLENCKLPNGVDVEEITFQLSCLMYTEDFFELDFSDSKKLLWELTSYEYYKVISTRDCDECDIHWVGGKEDCRAYYEIYSEKHGDELVEVSNLNSIINKYNNWKEYCKFVDEAKYYIQTLHPNYKKLNKKEKLEFIELLSQTQFTKDIAELLDNYHLNKFKQAKIDKLISLNLPNITDSRTAQQITELYTKQNS